jgi:hypothetical protein
MEQPAPDSHSAGYASDRERTAAQGRIRTGAGDEKRESADSRDMAHYAKLSGSAEPLGQSKRILTTRSLSYEHMGTTDPTMP